MGLETLQSDRNVQHDPRLYPLLGFTLCIAGWVERGGRPHYDAGHRRGLMFGRAGLSIPAGLSEGAKTDDR
jgi:hypothetical protein